MKERLSLVLALVVCIGLVALAVGCETTKGLGRDIENLGEAMSGER